MPGPSSNLLAERRSLKASRMGALGWVYFYRAEYTPTTMNNENVPSITKITRTHKGELLMGVHKERNCNWWCAKWNTRRPS